MYCKYVYLIIIEKWNGFEYILIHWCHKIFLNCLISSHLFDTLIFGSVGIYGVFKKKVMYNETSFLNKRNLNNWQNIYKYVRTYIHTYTHSDTHIK